MQNRAVIEGEGLGVTGDQWSVIGWSGGRGANAHAADGDRPRASRRGDALEEGWLASVWLTSAHS